MRGVVVDEGDDNDKDLKGLKGLKEKVLEDQDLLKVYLKNKKVLDYSETPGRKIDSQFLLQMNLRERVC